MFVFCSLFAAVLLCSVFSTTNAIAVTIVVHVLLVSSLPLTVGLGRHRRRRRPFYLIVR
jgi:hypothetical protein